MQLELRPGGFSSAGAAGWGPALARPRVPPVAARRPGSSRLSPAAPGSPARLLPRWTSTGGGEDGLCQGLRPAASSFCACDSKGRANRLEKQELIRV